MNCGYRALAFSWATFFYTIKFTDTYDCSTRQVNCRPLSVPHIAILCAKIHIHFLPFP